MQLRQALVLPLELEPELELPASIYLTSLRSMCMPAAHGGAQDPCVRYNLYPIFMQA